MSFELTKTSSHKVFGGEQLQISHRSEVLQCDMHFSVFLPPKETRKNRVLLWLSGLTCNDQNFVTKAGAQKKAAELGITLVCPDTSPRGLNVADDEAYDLGQGAGFYVNATQMPWKSHYQMYDYVNEELMGIILKEYSDIKKIAISGHSMGGHGALISALKNADAFVSFSALAPIANPINCPWGQKAFSAYLGDETASWEEYDAIHLLSLRQTAFDMPGLIDQGSDDQFLEEQLLAKPLEDADKLGNAEIRFQSGYDHSYFFVSTFIDEHIEFHAKHLNGK